MSASASKSGGGGCSIVLAVAILALMSINVANAELMTDKVRGTRQARTTSPTRNSENEYGITPSWHEYQTCITQLAARLRSWQRKDEAIDYWEFDEIFAYKQ